MVADRNEGFIQLNRTFHELPEQSPIDDDNDVELDVSFVQPVGKRLTWSDLLLEHRVILLSEAGSGKTTEMKHVARHLSRQGKPAFFLRLENIRSLDDFKYAFEEGEFQTFEHWIRSTEPGWLLLDSVDEARLRCPKDFERAIRIISKQLDIAKNRAHIVISSRSTAWRPKKDLMFCQDQLPDEAAAESMGNQAAEIIDHETTRITEPTKATRLRNGFKIVALAELNDQQIINFASNHGIKIGQVFLEEVKRAGAQALVTRPQDLKWLIEYYNENHKIGSGLEIIQASIDNRLMERDQDRAESKPLNEVRARKGCLLLAATTTLARSSGIRVPDGPDHASGLDAYAALHDWGDKKDYAILLERPIFDAAIYGVVRFHHRTVREYLCAEWLAELLQRNTSRLKIEDLCFKEIYGEKVVVPSLRPVLPWLAILDEGIRMRVCKIAPEIFFEGGDPGQLALEVRRNILSKVCAQIAERQCLAWWGDTSAIQRFAKPDLADAVGDLLANHAHSNDVKAFLLRLVWLGELRCAIAEAMTIALEPTSVRDVRVYAFRAIRAVGSGEEQERVRQSFLNESPELKRLWLSELLVNLPPTEETITWLFNCLEKIETEKTATVTFLPERIQDFFSAADLESLPQIVAGCNRLLSLPPLIERKHIEVSWRYRWLLAPATFVMERLIKERHPACLDEDALQLLHYNSFLRPYAGNLDLDGENKLAEIVPAWKELNRALFWFQIRHEREACQKKPENRVTSVHDFHFEPFWRFSSDDFAEVAQEITQQPLRDDQLVALSLAIELCIAAACPPAWRTQLHKLTESNEELTDRLHISLRLGQLNTAYPLQNPEAKRKEREQNEINKQHERREWITHLQDHLPDARDMIRSNPGLITEDLVRLSREVWGTNWMSIGTMDHCWQSKLAEFGPEIAEFFREKMRSLWRHTEPTLRPEGASNVIPEILYLSLNGIKTEAFETRDWAKTLSEAEVRRACKYAFHELNKFPDWFADLSSVHPVIISELLCHEISHELAVQSGQEETHDIIRKIAWSGQWLWDQIAPDLLQILGSEPPSIPHLENSLKILQGSKLENNAIAKLASKKCSTLNEPGHLARWFAVWTGVAPDDSITAIEEYLHGINDNQKQTSFAMAFVTCLWGNSNRQWAGVRDGFQTPKHLQSLYRLMLKYIRADEDHQRAGIGPYTPDERDHAEEARDRLFGFLKKQSGKESYVAMRDMALSHPNPLSQAWMLQQTKTKAEQDGDLKPWTPQQVREFHDKLERTPTNHQELAELAKSRLLDLKHEWEDDDISIAGILINVHQETQMRKFIAAELRKSAGGRYSIPQEEELADSKRPDLRFHGKGFDAPVPVELKLADNWTGPDLFEGLKKQLCGDYLRDARSRRGIYLLVYQGSKKRWDFPGNKAKSVDFEGLIKALQDEWEQISQGFSDIDEITVIGIDLGKRSRDSAQKEG